MEINCPHCEEILDVPRPAAFAVIAYHHQGGVLTHCTKCRGGIILSGYVQFCAGKYTGDKTKDDWGNELKQEGEVK